jgi:hypothetical protein
MDPGHPSPPPPSLVHPGSQTQQLPPSTLQTDLLLSLGLVVNTSHRILICLAYKGIIDLLDIRKHFQRHHQSDKTKLDIQDVLNKEAKKLYPNLTYLPTQPVTPIPPIYGLQDPVPNYLMCAKCNRCFASKKTYGQHSSCGTLSDLITTAAQRYINNTFKPWFPVQATLPPHSDTTSCWAVYQSQLSATASSTVPLYSDDFKVLHQFLHGECWLQHVQGFKHEELIDLALYSTFDTSYGGLHSHIFTLLSNIQSKLDEPLIQRAIGSRLAEEKEQVKVQYHINVTQPTLQRYSRVVAAMICLIHRVILNDNVPYTFSMPSEIVDACSDLISTLPLAVSNVNQQKLDEDETLELSESSDDEECSDEECSDDKELPRIPLGASPSATISTVAQKTVPMF